MHIFLTEPNSLTNSYYLNNYHRQLFRTLTWSKAKFKALICKKKTLALDIFNGTSSFMSLSVDGLFIFVVSSCSSNAWLLPSRAVLPTCVICFGIARVLSLRNL